MAHGLDWSWSPSTWVCLKIGYIPNYSHLIGIMISKTIGFRGTNHFQTNPLDVEIVGHRLHRCPDERPPQSLPKEQERRHRKDADGAIFGQVAKDSKEKQQKCWYNEERERERERDIYLLIYIHGEARNSGNMIFNMFSTKIAYPGGAPAIPVCLKLPVQASGN